MRKSFLYITIFFLISAGFLFGFSLIIKAQVGLEMIDFMEEKYLEESGENINLEYLDLYWSADTYTPFGYQGRALPTIGSLIEVEADIKVSNGKAYDLQYSWFLDNVFQESKSGYGRDDFNFRIRRNKGRFHTVLVKIFNKSRSFYVERSINIPITNPEVIVYKKDKGITIPPYISSSKTFNIISDKEMVFLALPYFFNIDSLTDLEFKWELGKKSIKESSFTANMFGLKIINKKVEGILEEKLNLLIINKDWDNQRVSKKINISIY